MDKEAPQKRCVWMEVEGGGHALTFYMFLYSFKFEYSLGNELNTLTVNKSIQKKTPVNKSTNS